MVLAGHPHECGFRCPPKPEPSEFCTGDLRRNFCDWRKHGAEFSSCALPWSSCPNDLGKRLMQGQSRNSRLQSPAHARLSVVDMMLQKQRSRLIWVAAEAWSLHSLSQLAGRRAKRWPTGRAIAESWCASISSIKTAAPAYEATKLLD